MKCDNIFFNISTYNNVSYINPGFIKFNSKTIKYKQMNIGYYNFANTKLYIPTLKTIPMDCYQIFACW